MMSKYSQSGEFGYGPAFSGMNSVDTLQFDSITYSSAASSLGKERIWGDIVGAPKVENSMCAYGSGGMADSRNMSSSVARASLLSKANDRELMIELDLNFPPCLDGEIVTDCRDYILVDEEELVDWNHKFDLNVIPSEDLERTEGPLNHSAAQLSAKCSGPSNWVCWSDSALSGDTGITCSLTLPSIANEVKLVLTSPDVSPTVMTGVNDLAACYSGSTVHRQRNSNFRNCEIPGCGKGARGGSRRCIAHGGGQRCQKLGCQRGAEGRTIYCKAHGGGRRCQFLGCTRSAEGRTELCIAHGGGQRCCEEGCTRAARGKSGLCIRHGGGKRCTRENCPRSAEGLSGLCISHGGGRRCQIPSCTKGAQGSTKFCKAHGGGKRCTYVGCTKGAEGSTPFCKSHGGGKRCSFQGGGLCPKSVHGGTLFCVAHGGGKRCCSPGCSKSARGRTDYCVRHGGGRRCKSDGCGKSAQGSTEFCKAHGGGRRCSWGQQGSSYGIGDTPCEKFARSKTLLCAAHGSLIEDQCVRGGGTLVLLSAQHAAGKMDVLAFDAFARSSSDEDLSRRRLLLDLAPPEDEGRVHGGSRMAFLFQGGRIGKEAHP